MIWYTDVIFELIFLTQQSNHKYVSITFTKVTNVKYEKTHQTVHEGCKNFKCESCGKSFTQADFLSRHINIIH